ASIVMFICLLFLSLGACSWTDALSKHNTSPTVASRPLAEFVSKWPRNPLLVNLSERITPPARLQNRACDFRRTRLLNVFCFVMQHGTRDGMVTVSVEQLEVGLLVVPVVTIHMVNL